MKTITVSLPDKLVSHLEERMVSGGSLTPEALERE